MPVIDLFSDRADLYATARPRYPEALYEFLATCVDRRERVWDCGAGNGQAAVAIAAYFSEVYATDVSEQQIANAIPKTNVFYSVQPAEKTNFPNACFDAVVVATALHWFDLPTFWQEVKRVLRDGGIFAAWGYGWLSISPAIDGVIKAQLRDVIEPYWSPRLQLLWNSYRDIEFPFESIPAPALKMQVAWNLPELLAYLHTWSATRQCMQQQGTEFFEALGEELAQLWGNPEDRKEVGMDLHMIAGRHSV
jgi:SAM-dependent methyltransferase